MTSVLDRLVARLPRNLQPYAKAVLPLVAALVAALITWAITGTFDTASITIAATGAVTSLITLVFPNHPEYVDLAEEVLTDLAAAHALHVGDADHAPEVDDRSPEEAQEAVTRPTPPGGDNPGAE